MGARAIGHATMIAGARVIAVEEHYATEAFVEETAALPVFTGEDREMSLMRALQGSGRIHDRLVDFDARLAEMDASGTDLAVLSLNPPGVQPYDSDRATEIAGGQNEALAEIVRSRPDRFAGLGSIAPQDVDWSAAEIGRIVGSLGLGGVMICSHTHGRYLDLPEFTPILEAAEAADATLYLHPRSPSPQMVEPYESYGMIGALWGYQAEAGTHAVRLILSGTLDRFPKLRLVLGHLGEALPYWMNRLDDLHAFTYRAAGERLGMPKLELVPSEYLRRNFTVTTSGMYDSDVLSFALSRLDEDSIMYAIDYPYEESVMAGEFLRDAELTDAQRAKISHGNAERLLRVRAGD